MTSVLRLVSSLLILLLQGQHMSSEIDCPTWTYPSPRYNNCLCGESFDDIVDCNSAISQLRVTINEDNYCMFFSEEFNTTLIGSCPYAVLGEVTKNASELKHRNGRCEFLHRKGELCGECEDNYTLPVYSHYLGCVKCEDYKYGWLKFIAAAFLPLTLFYVIVIVFRISATSPALNGYVLVSQIAATPTMVHLVYTFKLRYPIIESQIAVVTLKFITALYAIWNLDFFRSFYKPLCLYPNITYQQVLILDYAVALYPLLLIFITYILVKLHDNFAVVVWLWRPFHKCLVRFRKQWNIQSYLINALTTFIVLSYVKILNVSFQFLTFSQAYNMTRAKVDKTFWYYDGRVDMASKDYLPYLILALSMLLIFNILPLVLLALYPFKCFQKCLDLLCCVKLQLTLQIFTDTFHGCYKDKRRHFAALYLAVRFLNLLFLSTVHYSLYFKALELMLVVTLALVAKNQPYKKKWNNHVDMAMLTALISWYIFLYFSTEVTDESFSTHALPNFMFYMSSFLPLSYAVLQMFPWTKKCRKCFRNKRVLRTMLNFRTAKERNEEEEALLDNEVSE